MIDLRIFFISLASIFVFMLIMFVIALIIKNNGIIDSCWSLNFILATIISFIWSSIQNDKIHLTQLVITVLILIWGIRLSYHITQRSIGKPEDRRYAERREKWGKSFYVKTFFLIFMLQALWSAIIVSPVIAVNSIIIETVSDNTIVIERTAQMLIPLITGSILWLLGFYFEAIGDRQLKLFIRDPKNKGKIIEQGLWRFTRHPNYFGETTMSWGLFVIAIPFFLTANTYFFWFTIIGPIMYTLLIRYVTGVPEVEKHLISKPGYEEYMKRTSVLFPLPPKKENLDKE